MKQTKINQNASEELVVVWTSGDVYVAERMVLMYSHTAVSKNFFSKIILIIWGPSAKLAAENLKIQKLLISMQNDGIIIKACITCAKEYGVEKELTELGFEVKAMGKILTDYIKRGANVLTF